MSRRDLVVSTDEIWSWFTAASNPTPAILFRKCLSSTRYSLLPSYLTSCPMCYSEMRTSSILILTKSVWFGALRRFDTMFGSEQSSGSSAVSPSSKVHGTPTSQSSPVSPQNSPASQPTSSQPQSVLSRIPTKRKGIRFFCVVAPGMTRGAPSESTLSYLVFSFCLVLFCFSIFSFSETPHLRFRSVRLIEDTFVFSHRHPRCPELLLKKIKF